MKTPFRVRNLLFLFSFVVVGLLEANAQRIISKKYSMEDGLSSNRIYSIVQDSLGFMWFGTNDGLNRFDGIKFISYKFSETLGAISSNGVRNLYIDRRNKIWVALDNGVNIYDPTTDTFSRFSVKTDSGEEITSRVYDIIEDKEGCFWIATMGMGVYRYNAKRGKLTSFRKDSSEKIDLGSVIDLHEDSKGYIWFGTYSEGLYCFDKKTNQFTIYTQDKTMGCLSDNSVQKIYEDSYGNLWIGTFQNGLDRFNYTTKTFTNYRDNSVENMLYHIHDIREHQPGELIVASDNGVGLFKIEEGRIIPSDHTPLKISKTSNKFIYSLFIDKEESLWMGSYFDGLDFYSSFQNNFDYFSCTQSVYSKEGKVINVVREDKKNSVFWIGTDDNGIFKFDAVTKKATPFRTAADIGSTYYCIHDILLDNGSIYVATYERGLEVFDVHTGKSKSYMHNPHDPNSLPSSRLFVLYKSSNGRIYIGTSRGLCYYNREKDNFVRVEPSKRVSSILEDSHGKIWVATYENGLYSYDLKTNKLELYQYKPNDCNSLVWNAITTLALDHQKRLWIGSDGYGICRYNEATNNFTRFNQMEFPNHMISAIIPEGDNLWITTNKGLVYCNPDNGHLKAYSKSNGLFNEQFSPGAGIKSNDGKIYLGSTNGFCCFSPQSLVRNTFNPNVLITNMTISGKKVLVNEENSPLQLSIEYSDELTLNSKQSMVGFEFASLSYVAPGDNQYRYMLEGFDTEWHSTTGKNLYASYTNLPPGEYVLRVKGTNSDKIWSTNEAALKIRVLPPFFKSRWAYLIYTILLLVIISYAIRFYIGRSTEKQQKKIDKLNTEKEKELYNSKIEFFTNIAHEIRTPLSLIIGPLEVLMKSKSVNDSHGGYLGIIEQNYKRLYRLVNELLDFRKVDAGIYKLSYTSCNLRKVIEAITTRFDWTARQKGVVIDISAIPEDITIVVDEEALTKIISNLLTNGMKYAKKQITLSFEEKNRGISLCVTDDGIGIADDEKTKIFDAFYQVKSNTDASRLGIGIGLHLTHSLVNLMGGRIEAIDREDGKSGASIVIFLPQGGSDVEIERQEKKIDDIFILEPTNPSYEDVKEEMDDDVQVQKQYSILAVDDNPEILDFLSKILSSEYFVISAMSGEEALNILINNQVDLILSDVMMGGMDGFELCRCVKTDLNTSHIPIVLLTAKTDTESKIAGLEVGADAYIEKPFSSSHLQAQLKNLLKKRSELKEKYASMPLSLIHSTVHNKLDEDFIDRCTEIITQNISEPEFSVNTLAQELGMSRTGIFVKLKGITGMTPNDFIKVIRLKTASKMMVEGEYRITEIGFLVGFSSSSYFAKCFQKQFGKLPTEFVKDMRGEQIIED